MSVNDCVIEEVPVALVYNGISHAVMLATPTDLEDFALGFSLSEGIVTSVADVHGIEVDDIEGNDIEGDDIVGGPGTGGISVQLTIATSRLVALKARRRALAGRTGCGLCGVETLRDAVRPVRIVASAEAIGAVVDRAALTRAFAELDAQQCLHQATGAAHAAGFATWRGELVLMREDVGRHNALDKLIGAMAARNRRVDPASGFVVVTSRASYEMVQKTAAAGCGLIAALAAPTALAVRTAHEAGVTLIGFAARADARIYSHPGRMTRVAIA